MGLLLDYILLVIMVFMVLGSYKYILVMICIFCWNFFLFLVGWSNLGGFDKEEVDKVWRGWFWLVMVMWVCIGVGGLFVLNL